jgi:hypothetical protein
MNLQLPRLKLRPLRLKSRRVYSILTAANVEYHFKQLNKMLNKTWGSYLKEVIFPASPIKIDVTKYEPLKITVLTRSEGAVDTATKVANDIIKKADKKSRGK